MDGTKSMLEKLYVIFDDVGERTGLAKAIKNPDATTSILLKADILHFLSYLAVSDGIISRNETQYISELLDMELTPQSLNAYIIENKIYSETFERKVPLSTRLMVEIDNILFRQGELPETNGSTLILGLFSKVARGLVESIGMSWDDMNFDIKNNIEIYLGTMKRYIDKNLAQNHEDLKVTYTKRKETIGVEAPRKNSVIKIQSEQRQSGSVKAPGKKVI